MIRVNLLPQKRDTRTAKPESSQKWLFAVLGVLVLEIIGLFVFHQHKVEQLNAQKLKNDQLQSQINDIKKFVSNHEDIKKQLVVLRAREDAIAKLQTARSGPTAVLLELAQLLTPGKGPTADPDRLAQLRKENPLSVYNPGWDSRRLWLNKYDERGRVVTIDGLARDGNDVYELAQRLKLSSYFYDVKLLEGKKEVEAKTKVELVKFSLELKVRY